MMNIPTTKRLLYKALVVFATLFALPCTFSAQTQNGYVRTATRPNAPSERLEGVTLRARGSHNMVLTTTAGDFQLLLPEQSAGEAFALSSVRKAGYELIDADLIGRQLAFSSKVPLEIVMVSQAQLQADKQRIADAARNNIETYYEQRLTELNKQLADARLSNEQYEQQLTELEEKYERFEPLIEQLSDRYARTDYAQLDDVGAAINEAIESGDLDKAQQLILAKGDPAAREKRLREIQREAAFQLKDLASDYYNLYTIHLSRFQNDSALYYITARAELDTTRAAWSLDAGQFIDNFYDDHERAMQFLQRGLRHALRQEGERSSLAAFAYSNIGCTLYRQKNYSEAMRNLTLSRDIYTELEGNNSPHVAGRLSSIGAVFYQQKDLKNASRNFQQALQIYNSAEGDHKSMIAEVENNLAAIEYSHKHYSEAASHYKGALANLVSPKDDRTRIDVLKNLGVVYYYAGQKQDALTTMEQAAELAQTVLGDTHPLTAQCRKLLQFLQK